MPLTTTVTVDRSTVMGMIGLGHVGLFEAKGARVDCYDPHIPVLSSSREHGDIAGRLSRPLAPDYDCFLLVTAHSCFTPVEILAQGVPVVDTRRILPAGPLVFPA